MDSLPGPDDDEAMKPIFPVNRGLGFLLWIEDIRATLPEDAILIDAPTLHACYADKGIAGAAAWLSYRIEHPAGKGETSPPAARGYNHFLRALWELGLSTDFTRNQTRKLIEQREK